MSPLRIAPLVLFAAGAALAPACAAAQANESRPGPPPEIHSLDLSAIDKSADPCVDFYQYACGNWTKNNPIPADQVRWERSFSLLSELNRYRLWKELDAASTNPKDAPQKQYGDYYAACMNTDLIEKKGTEPLQPAFKRIAALDDTHRLADLVGDLAKSGEPVAFFRFNVQQDEKDSSKQIANISQAGLSLPDRDYYIVDNKHFQEIRQQYLAHATRMFTLAGDEAEKAAKEAAAVLRIETALARASTSRTEMRDPEVRYHIYAIAEFQKLAPDFDFAVALPSGIALLVKSGEPRREFAYSHSLKVSYFAARRLSRRPRRTRI